MRGDDLLLAHLGLRHEPGEEGTERPSAGERLERELGSALAERLVAALASRRGA